MPATRCEHWEQDGDVETRCILPADHKHVHAYTLGGDTRSIRNSTPPCQRHGHDPDDLMAWRRAQIAVDPLSVFDPLSPIGAPYVNPHPPDIPVAGRDYGPGRCHICGGPLNDDSDDAVWPCTADDDDEP